MSVVQQVGERLAHSQERGGYASAAVAWLYPDDSIPHKFDRRIPHYPLPLRSALLFLPSPDRPYPDFQQRLQDKWLQQVARPLLARGLLQEDSPQRVLDATEMAGGLESLQVLADSWQVDVIVLLSVDQLAHGADNLSQLLYWAMDGPYQLRARAHDVQTVASLNVIDARSGQLLAHTVGLHKVQASEQLLDDPQQMARARQAGLVLAVNQLSISMDSELGELAYQLRNEYRVGFNRLITAKGAAELTLAMFFASFLLN